MCCKVPSPPCSLVATFPQIGLIIIHPFLNSISTRNSLGFNLPNQKWFRRTILWDFTFTKGAIIDFWPEESAAEQSLYIKNKKASCLSHLHGSALFQVSYRKQPKPTKRKRKMLSWNKTRPLVYFNIILSEAGSLLKFQRICPLMGYSTGTGWAVASLYW